MRRKELRSFLSRALPFIVLPALGFLAVMIWRWQYFGAFLPNTASVKVEASAVRWEQGAKYLATQFLTFPSLIIPLLAPLIRMRERTRSIVQDARQRPAALLQSTWLALIAMCVYILSVGGDFMGMGRFLVPVLPFSALVLALMVHALFVERRIPVLVRAAVLLLPLLSLPPAFGSGKGLLPFQVIEKLHFRWSYPRAMTELQGWRTMKTETVVRTAKGRVLARISRPGDSVVLGAIGATGYYSRLKVYDRNGLVTPEVLAADTDQTARSPGHWKTVPPAFFLEHQPTFFDPLLDTPDSSEFSMRIRGAPGYIWKTFPLLPEEGMPPGSSLRVLCHVNEKDSPAGVAQ
jgi:hypothetical protein